MDHLDTDGAKPEEGTGQLFPLIVFLAGVIIPFFIQMTLCSVFSFKLHQLILFNLFVAKDLYQHLCFVTSVMYSITISDVQYENITYIEITFMLWVAFSEISINQRA